MTNHTFAILAYKESPHLQACIDSLKKQTLASNIILCTSTPNSFLTQIAKEHDLPLLTNPKKNGIASDWNFALSSSTTDFVTLAHQDDVYHENFAAEMMEALEKQPGALIAFSDYDEIVHDNANTFIRSKSLNFFIKRSMLRWYFRKNTVRCHQKTNVLAWGNPICCPSVTFNKNMLAHFRFDKTFQINLDWKAWLEISKREGCFLWINNILLSHRIYQESETTSGLADNRRQQEDLRIFSEMWPAFFAKLLSKVYSLSYRNND